MNLSVTIADELGSLLKVRVVPVNMTVFLSSIPRGFDLSRQSY